MFEKCNKCTFLLKNLQSLSYRCTGLTDFELTNDSDPPTHPHIEMLTHLKSCEFLQLGEKGHVCVSAGGHALCDMAMCG